MNEYLTLPGNYSLSSFEGDIANVKPRFFDTYVLPPFLMFYAFKSKDMGRVARRILFASGVYMFYRNYRDYKALVLQVKETLITEPVVS